MIFGCLETGSSILVSGLTAERNIVLKYHIILSHLYVETTLNQFVIRSRPLFGHIYISRGCVEGRADVCKLKNL